MSIELIFTLYVDADGNERFMIQHPVDTETLLDVTDQFRVATSVIDGQQAITFIRNTQPIELGIHDALIQ